MPLTFLLHCLPWGLRRDRASQPQPRRPQQRPRAARLCCEQLEDRMVPSTLTVLNNADSGSGSLRNTLAAAHNGDTIVFAHHLQGGPTITLMSQLIVSKDLDIEGPGAA